MLTAASRVPDHGRLVPWRFITIAGERRHDLSAVIRERFGDVEPGASSERRAKMQSRLSHAPLVVAVVFCPREHPKIPVWEQELTVGAVCMNLLHAAHAMGMGGLWLTEWYAQDRVVLDAMGIGTDERIAGFIHIGTPTEAREDRARPDLDAIVTVF